MKIKDTFTLEDEVSGLKITVIPRIELDRLHIEFIGEPKSVVGGQKITDRDFWFTKDGEFDGTGSTF